MNVFLTQLRRRAVLFSLLAILLAAVIAFLSIGFSALTAVRRQIRGVSGQYTTIAVPVEGSPGDSLSVRKAALRRFLFCSRRRGSPVCSPRIAERS